MTRLRTLKTTVRTLAAALLLGVAALGPAAPAQAHPGTCYDPVMQLLATGFSGPFFIAVTVNPANPMVGTAQMVVGVCDGDTLTPVEDARVTVTPVNPKGLKGAPILPLTKTSSPEDYAAPDLTFKLAGTWHYSVVVESPAGRGTLETDLVVREAPGFNEGSSMVFFAMNGVLLLGSAYFVWQLRRDRAKARAALAAR